MDRQLINSQSFSIDKSNWIKVKLGDVVAEARDAISDSAKENIEHVVGLEHIDSEDIRGALGRLHQGELEAIILAQELATDCVALDDLLARRNKAHSLGLKVIGTIGLLLLLEKRGMLDTEQTWEKICQLTEQHIMYLSPQLLQ